MTVFADASALVAIISGEPDAVFLSEKLVASPVRLTSAIAVWEASLAAARIAEVELDAGRTEVDDLVRRVGLTIVAVGAEEARLALDAHARFGKGRHPARLNMGDCFAYACARTNGAKLLYKGEDFALTDIEPA